MRVLRFIPLALVVAAGALPAQVVRGVVSERTSGAGLAGVVVELQVAGSAADARVASVLTDAAGSYALRAPVAGRYLVTAKRIGVRGFVSAAFALADGETRSLPIVLDAVLYKLPEVVVSASAICAADPGDDRRVAALWEEARTALVAVRLSLRDRLFTAQVTRYARELDPASMRTLSETRSETRGVVASPFLSLPAESLSTAGYWRVQPDGAAIYYGPDADVLLSGAFLRDHCFRAVRGTGERRESIGLAFTPVSGRPVPDIAGTVWLDARTFELQLVDFRYDRVREGVDPAALGGEVHFARLPSGAWIVRRWFIRMPVLGRPAQPVTTEGEAPWVLVRPSMVRLLEEGGLVTTDELRPHEGPGAIRGSLRDSSDRPMPATVVKIAGSSRVTTSDRDGLFAFDSVAAGSHTIIAQEAGYDSLGLLAADTALTVRPGQATRATLKARNARRLTLMLCDGRGAPFGRGTLYLAVRDSATGDPVPGLAVRLDWTSTPAPGQDTGVPRTLEMKTDERGIAVFCEIPADWPLTLRASPTGGGAEQQVRLSIPPRGVRRVDVRVTIRTRASSSP